MTAVATIASEARKVAAVGRRATGAKRALGMSRAPRVQRGGSMADRSSKDV
jgi:hypothetical protein